MTVSNSVSGECKIHKRRASEGLKQPFVQAILRIICYYNEIESKKDLL